MDREEIQKHIPHRPPMLLVDEATIDPDGVAHGKYRIREDDFFTQGHFPGNPVVPGVILCEIMAQCCTMLMLDDIPGHNTFYRAIDEVKFKNTVRPGDLCEVTAVLVSKRAGLYFADARLEVGGKLCCKGKLTFALVPKAKE